MSKKLKVPKGAKVIKEFDFPLTKDEFSEKGQGAAALSGEITELELQFEEVKETWKAKIKAREAKRDELLSVIRAKKERRSVDCIMEKDYEEKEIRYWFEGKVMESRTMTPAECQMEIQPGNVVASARARRQKIDKPAPIANGHSSDTAEDIEEVIKQEKSKRTKLSAVDGPVSA